MNNIIQISQQNPAFFLLMVGIISLFIGSFLNVVIVRLPIMLEHLYTEECREFLLLPKTTAKKDKPAFNLLIPRSHCPKCKHNIMPWQNIPIISFLLLRGKCYYCKQTIGFTYPAVELLTFVISLFIAWEFGAELSTFCALLLVWTLIAQSVIDLQSSVIPDEITMPILWLGLIVNCFSVFTTPIAAISGAVAGYLTLWVIYWIFKLITKKEGMGYGDFKLLAMLGAWLGWQQLPLIIILASLLGAIVGIVLIIKKDKTLSSAIPFGPYLAIAGFTALLYGQEINTFYLQYVGIIL